MNLQLVSSLGYVHIEIRWMRIGIVYGPMDLEAEEPPPQAARRTDLHPHLIHCSYHKCLTVYFGRVLKAVFNRCLPWSRGYQHYNSHLDDFYDGFQENRISSINNRALDLGRLGRFRISRFIRDPRDLIVSGYFYHKRGAEPWTRVESPTAELWYFANGCVPEDLRGGGASFAGYLQSLPEEEGLLAEMEFRTFHLESMARWPAEHPDIVTFRYEDVVADGAAVFRELFDFYGLGPLERRLGHGFARRYSLAGRKKDPHIRNPASGQWRKHFTPRVRQAFDEKYAGLIRQLGYAAD